MKNSVIAIGLDAADPVLLETWMSQGYLKNLQHLREMGAYGRLNNLEYYKAETPWTTFLTGCLPEKTGYWSPIKFHEGTYQAEQINAYNFDEYRPFYALGEDYRVAVFDMPQSKLIKYFDETKHGKNNPSIDLATLWLQLAFYSGEMLRLIFV